MPALFKRFGRQRTDTVIRERLGQRARRNDNVPVHATGNAA
jgi:hypothetical protein